MPDQKPTVSEKWRYSLIGAGFLLFILVSLFTLFTLPRMLIRLIIKSCSSGVSKMLGTRMSASNDNNDNTVTSDHADVGVYNNDDDLPDESLNAKEDKEADQPEESDSAPFDDTTVFSILPDINDLANFTEVVAGRLADLSDNSERLQGLVDELNTQITEKVAADRVREETIRKLDSELQGYRQDNLFEAIRPICAALINLHDIVLTFSNQSEKSENIDDVLENILEQILNVLRIAGVEEYSTAGERFVQSNRVRPEGIEIPPSDELDGIVSKTIAKGFGLRDRVLRPERVSIYKNQ